MFPIKGGVGVITGAGSGIGAALALNLAARGMALAIADRNAAGLATTAAAATLAGVARGRFEIRYPWRFATLMGLLRVLPYRWYFPLVRRMTGL